MRGTVRLHFKTSPPLSQKNLMSYPPSLHPYSHPSKSTTPSTIYICCSIYISHSHSPSKCSILPPTPIYITNLTHIIISRGGLSTPLKNLPLVWNHQLHPKRNPTCKDFWNPNITSLNYKCLALTNGWHCSYLQIKIKKIKARQYTTLNKVKSY